MTRRLLLTALCAALALSVPPALSVHAQTTGATGINVDAFQYTAGQRSQSVDITADAAGNLYACGYGNDAAGYSHWVVRKSTDSGQTWGIVDDFAYPGAVSNSAGFIAVTNGGVIYAAGGCRTSTDMSVIHWVVRRSTDGGSTWQTAEDYVYPGGNITYLNGMAVDGAGGVYLVGQTTLADSSKSSSVRWLVRRSADGVTNWQTTDVFQAVPGAGAVPRAVYVDSVNNVYVCGFDSSTSPSRWLIRKSMNGGASFSTLAGSFYQSGGQPFGMGVDTAGTIYVAGNNAVTTTMKRTTTTTVLHGIVRKSTNGGASFTTIDDFQYAAGGDTYFRDILVDSLGRVTVAGYGFGAPNSVIPKYNHWIVRRSSDGVAPFATIDDYSASATSNNTAFAITEAAGSLFTSGQVQFPDAGNTNWFWVVRKY